jgi:hypothetical protein
MGNKNIYSFLLEQGAPPEMIMRLMNQIKEGGSRPLMDNRNVGMRGSQAGQAPYGSRPQGIYSPSSPPRV